MLFDGRAAWEVMLKAFTRCYHRQKDGNNVVERVGYKASSLHFTKLIGALWGQKKKRVSVLFFILVFWGVLWVSIIPELLIKAPGHIPILFRRFLELQQTSPNLPPQTLFITKIF